MNTDKVEYLEHNIDTVHCIVKVLIKCASPRHLKENLESNPAVNSVTYTHLWKNRFVFFVEVVNHGALMRFGNSRMFNFGTIAGKKLPIKFQCCFCRNLVLEFRARKHDKEQWYCQFCYARLPY